MAALMSYGIGEAVARVPQQPMFAVCCRSFQAMKGPSKWEA